VRKVLACRSPVLGCHIYQCGSCGHVELIPHCCLLPKPPLKPCNNGLETSKK
jgi:hypothetical protein